MIGVIIVSILTIVLIAWVWYDLFKQFKEQRKNLK